MACADYKVAGVGNEANRLTDYQNYIGADNTVGDNHTASHQRQHPKTRRKNRFATTSRVDELIYKSESKDQLTQRAVYHKPQRNILRTQERLHKAAEIVSDKACRKEWCYQ